MDETLLDLLAKTVFKNVKRRRFTDDQKKRIRDVAEVLQEQLTALKQADCQGTDDESKRAQAAKRRLRLNWRRTN